MASWIIYSQPRPSASLRLFAFSHAGGGAGAFRGWADRLGEDIELGYVQLPGRESRYSETRFISIPQMIPILVDALAKELNRPFAFYGHSLGGKIAFEVARELRRRNRPGPAHLFVAACPAPQLPWPLPFIHGMETTGFLEEMQRRYGGIPRQVMEDEELVALLAPMLRADVTMIETYVCSPEPALETGITVFGGLEDHTIKERALALWREQTVGDFSLQMKPGNHFFPQLPQGRVPESVALELKASVGTRVPL